MNKCVKRFKFSRDWLENEKYKSWIREVPNDDSKYFCCMCNKTFSCKTRVTVHAESETHRNNISHDCSEETQAIVKESRRRKFSHSWLEQFKPWLEKIPNDPYSCFCSFCNKTFRCGLDALRRHSDTKKHVSECQKRGLTVDLNTLEETSSLSFEDRKKIAEIKFAALIAEKNIPFQTAEAILTLFQDIGKDPGVLQSMTVNRKKVSRIINNVLCTREQERLTNILQNKFSIFIDETSDSTNDKWMTFLVRYVDPQTLNVRTELFKLIHLDASDCSAEKLFIAFRSEMWKYQIPFQNILAYSCDNASVMTGKYESFKKKLEQHCKNLITMPCPCHSSALVANAACKAIPEACEELLRKVASFISSSPKRACIFKQFQEAYNFDIHNKNILKLSETRWLSRHLCVARLNENWDVLLKFLQEEQASEKSKSGASLLLMMQNPEIQAYLLFLEYILDAFNKFNASFQAQETRVHLLQSSAENLLKTILRNVVKAPLLEFVAIGTINPSLACNRRSPDQVLVGQACQDLLDRLNEEGQGKIVQSVYANCLQFYDIAAKEIRQRLFVKEEFLSKLRIFDPKFAVQEDKENKPDTVVQDVLVVAKRFGGFDEEMLRNEWQRLHVDFASERKDFILTLDFDDAWKVIMTTKDTNNKLKYPTIMKLINTIRSLPNSNADAERIFSMLTDVKTKKRNALSSIHVNALCIFKSCLRARGETSLTMTVDARHLALMESDNLNKTNDIKNACSLRLFGVDDSPSTSSDL